MKNKISFQKKKNNYIFHLIKTKKKNDFYR